MSVELLVSAFGGILATHTAGSGTNTPTFRKFLQENPELMRRECSCSARSDVVEMVVVLLHTRQDTAAYVFSNFYSNFWLFFGKL